jgi:peptidoglycan hydrolase CwlO-like protein
MLTKTQLQQEVQNLETKLQEFQEQLNSHKEVTIETASVGDTLEDGSIVLQKENGLALLVAPKSTEVEASWSKEFSEVFEALKSRGFNPSQWFIPTQEQLKLAYRNVPNEFSATRYWSSTEINASGACFVFFDTGSSSFNFKTNVFCVRAFRCVTY